MAKLLKLVALFVVCCLRPGVAQSRRYTIRVHGDQGRNGDNVPLLFVGQDLFGKLLPSFWGAWLSSNDAPKGRQIKEATKYPRTKLDDMVKPLTQFQKQTRHMFEKHSRGGEEGMLRILACHVTVDGNGTRVRADGTLVFSDRPSRLTGRLAPEPVEYKEGTDDICRRLQDALQWDVAKHANQKTKAAALSGRVFGAADGKVMLTCTAQGFYPYDNVMYFKTHSNKSAQGPTAYFAAVPAPALTSGLYKRSIYTFVDPAQVSKTGCFFHHGTQQNAPRVFKAYSRAVRPLCPRAQPGSPTHTLADLKDFTEKRKAKSMTCDKALPLSTEGEDFETGPWPWHG